jgi:vacuolar-type H+-ATPase subunit E/Vma4
MNVEPLRTSFLAAATADTERRLADCREECAQRIGAARREADELIEQARRAGEADARAQVPQTLVTARRRAHAEVLAAQQQVYEEFRRAAHAALLALRGTPGYPTLLERLASAARAQLGEDAVIDVDPPDVGGVIGTKGSCRVDYSLPALADRLIDDVGDDASQLWA